MAWPHEGKLLIYTSWAGEHLHFRIKGLIYLIPKASIFVTSIVSLYIEMEHTVFISEYICTKIRPCERNWFWPNKKDGKRRYLSEGRLLSYKIYYHLNQKPHEVRWIRKNRFRFIGLLRFYMSFLLWFY